MRFVDWLERHVKAITFLGLALVLGGALAAVSLPLSLFPVVSFPRVRVVIDSGSMPARKMLVATTEPLEKVARSVPGATNVESITSRGSAEIFVDFPWGTDMKQALLTVNSAFAQKLPDLSPQTRYKILQMSPTAIMPVISYALTSKSVSPEQLRSLAEHQIAPLLMGVTGVKKVGVLGGQTPEVQVYVKPGLLSNYGITLKQIVAALRKTNSDVSVGHIQDNSLLYLTFVNGAFHGVKSVKNVMIATADGTTVPLGRIATITMGHVPRLLLVNENGHSAVTFGVYQQTNANSVAIGKAVRAKLDTFMKSQPSSVHLSKWYDQTRLVGSSIRAVEEAIVLGIIFAACVIFWFLRNWRATFVAMIVVPMSVLVTCLLLLFFGMSFNIMTLGGIAASIGLLIDDAIVMIEQIARRAAAPDQTEPKRTVFAATREFLSPLTGSSLATIVMFIPLAFLSGVTGAFFKFLSITMASALGISYLFTLFVVPILARSLINFAKWDDPSHGRETRATKLHRGILGFLDRRRWAPLLIVAGVVGVGYFGLHHVGTGFLPKMDEGGFVLDYQTAPGTSLHETNRELREVEGILHADPYVKNYSRRVGAGLGGDLVETYQGDFFVKLVPASDRPPIWTVMDSITAKINAKVPGVSFDLHQLLGDMIGDMVGRRQPVVIKFSAQDPTTLPKIARKVAGAISKVPGVQPSSVNDGVVPAGDALEIHVNPVAAASFGLSVADITGQVSKFLQGDVVTKYVGKHSEIGVRLWAGAKNEEARRAGLEDVPIRTPQGRLIPLSTVAKVVFQGGQPQLTRSNLAQIVAVTAQIGGGHDLGSTIAAVKKRLETPGFLPKGVSYTIGGAYKQQQIAARGMVKVFGAAIVAELILLLFLYESLWIALIVVGSSAVAVGAVFTGLWLAGVELNITAMMGMVMIVGIATEMSIFLVSEYQLLRRSMPDTEAIFEAAINRLRPITMSTLAMILALLPLGAAISGSGDQMLQPLALAIISGTIIQLPMVLFVMPVLIRMTMRRTKTFAR